MVPEPEDGAPFCTSENINLDATISVSFSTTLVRSIIPQQQPKTTQSQEIPPDTIKTNEKLKVDTHATKATEAEPCYLNPLPPPSPDYYEPTYEIPSNVQHPETGGQYENMQSKNLRNDADSLHETSSNWRFYFRILAVICCCLSVTCCITIGKIVINGSGSQNSASDYNQMNSLGVKVSNFDDCKDQIEDSVTQWLNSSVEKMRCYTGDEDKALQCHHFTPAPHYVLQSILKSYESLNKTCEVTMLKISDGFRTQALIHVQILDSAKEYMQSVRECLGKTYCPKSQQENGSCASTTSHESLRTEAITNGTTNVFTDYLTSTQSEKDSYVSNREVDLDRVVLSDHTTEAGTFPPSSTATSEACLYTELGLEYTGTVNTTIQGYPCQAWSSQTPHTHRYTTSNGYTFPDGSDVAAGNRCRNPGGSSVGPWCIIANLPDKPWWGRCNISYCKTSETCRNTTLGRDYTGPINTTTGGHPCQAWSSQTPRVHDYTTSNGYTFPDGSDVAAGNRCRNPDGHLDGPWCFTADVKAPRWELCNIPRCQDIQLSTTAPSGSSKSSTNASSGPTSTASSNEIHLAPGTTTIVGPSEPNTTTIAEPSGPSTTTK